MQFIKSLFSSDVAKVQHLLGSAATAAARAAEEKGPQGHRRLRGPALGHRNKKTSKYKLSYLKFIYFFFN